MFRFWMILALVFVLFGSSACGGDTTSEDNDGAAAAVEADEGAEEGAAVALAGDADLGEEMFGSTCSACHGPAGEGVEGLGKDMTTSAFIAGLNDDELMSFVKQGRPPGDPDNTTGVDMPPKGGNPALSDEDMAHIIAYMRAIQK